MITSTVPGAIQTLQGYLSQVAANNPAMNISTHLGEPIETVGNNFMAIGNYDMWIPVQPDTYAWAAIPGASQLIKEEYVLQGCIRSWTGNVDPLGRLTDAYTMLNGLHQAVRNDIGGSGTLSPSGSWGDLVSHMIIFGPQGDLLGTAVVLDFELHVINAQITGP